MLRPCKQQTLLALPAWLATLVVCLHPLLILAHETAAACGCQAETTIATCCESASPQVTSRSCCTPIVQTTRSCCCASATVECQCDDCECGNGNPSFPAFPLSPPTHETIDFLSITSLCFPAHDIYAVTSESDTIPIAARIAGGTVQTAHQICVLLSRFTC